MAKNGNGLKNEVVIEKIMIGDVECINNEYSALLGNTGETVSVKVPNKFIFEGTVQDCFWEEEFDFKVKAGKDSTSEKHQDMKFYVPEIKEVTKIYKGEINSMFDFVALLGDKIENEVMTGYRTLSYSIFTKTGDCVFGNMQSATCIAIIARITGKTYTYCDRHVYQPSVGRGGKGKGGSARGGAKKTNGNTFNYGQAQ